MKSGAVRAGLAVCASASVPAGAAAPSEEKIDELRKLGERSRFVNSVRAGSVNNPERRLPDEPRDVGLKTPLQDSEGIITPAELHFIVSHGYEPPDIDPREHRLLIHGMVDHPLILTLDDLKRLPGVSRFHFVECHGNSTTSGPAGATRNSPWATIQDTHGLTSCSQWTGVLLSLPGNAQSSVPEIPFETATDFFKYPPEMNLGEIVAVAVNSRGHIFLLSRSNATGNVFGGIATQLLEFDQSGRFVREIGKGLYGFAFGHGVRVDKYDNVWVVDKGTNMVMKFNQIGHVTMVLGRREEATDEHVYPDRSKASIQIDGMFNQPTDIAWDSTVMISPTRANTSSFSPSATVSAGRLENF